MPAIPGYSRSQVWLHWIVAALVAAQYVFKDAIGRAWEAALAGVPSAFDPLVAAHVVGGVVILILMVWRLALRVQHPVPLAHGDPHPLLAVAARMTHRVFYAVVIALAVTGLLAWFGQIGAAATAHAVLKMVLLALVGLHVAAALFHRLVLKSDVMSRMRPARS